MHGSFMTAFTQIEDGPTRKGASTVLSINFVGDGLRDLMDPHQRAAL